MSALKLHNSILTHDLYIVLLNNGISTTNMTKLHTAKKKKCGENATRVTMERKGKRKRSVYEKQSSRGDFLPLSHYQYMLFGIRQSNITSKHGTHYNSQDSL